ncbi:MAG: hypothetical protein ABI977_29125 [Acidobacteriota bacterium]
MAIAVNSTYGQALDLIDSLPIEEQESLLEIVERRLIERRRAEIARDAVMTLAAVQQRQASSGSVEDLKRELLDEL